MLPLRSTGRPRGICRVLGLTLLIFVLVPAGLVAQGQDSPTTPAPVALNASTDTPEGQAATSPDNPRRAANPAMEPDTWMLLGTGAVVLLLLYARRRVRVLAPQQESA